MFQRKTWFIFADFSDVFISYMWHNLGSCQIGLCFWFICILLIKNQLDFDSKLLILSIKYLFYHVI